jgi:hypothetical protein
VARETRDTNLLEEAGQLVEALADPLETMSGLLGMVAVTAGWGDRARTHDLLGRLEVVARAIEENLGGESKPVAGKVRQVLKLCSTRIRSLTEVSQSASDTGTILRDLRYDTPSSGLPGRFHGPRTHGLPPEQALLKELTEGDWAYVVEDLVDRCPDAYPAIIAELDALTTG